LLSRFVSWFVCNESHSARATETPAISGQAGVLGLVQGAPVETQQLVPASLAGPGGAAEPARRAFGVAGTAGDLEVLVVAPSAPTRRALLVAPPGATTAAAAASPRRTHNRRGFRRRGQGSRRRGRKMVGHGGGGFRRRVHRVRDVLGVHSSRSKPSRLWRSRRSSRGSRSS
jgi:hypothetical protein